MPELSQQGPSVFDGGAGAERGDVGVHDGAGNVRRICHQGLQLSREAGLQQREAAVAGLVVEPREQRRGPRRFEGGNERAEDVVADGGEHVGCGSRE